MKPKAGKNFQNFFLESGILDRSWKGERGQGKGWEVVCEVIRLSYDSGSEDFGWVGGHG